MALFHIAHLGHRQAQGRRLGDKATGGHCMVPGGGHANIQAHNIPAAYPLSCGTGITAVHAQAAGGMGDSPHVPSTCRSSPDSYICIMMSEPPMNSPFTYSCGMVGQLLYSLMPWRIASSSSTLTVTTALGST